MKLHKMRLSSIISVSAIGVSAVLGQTNVTNVGEAPITTHNPEGKSAIAALPEQPFFKGGLDGNVKGFISVKSGANGYGVDYEVFFTNLPKEGGPFTYHLHVDPVPADGNCTKTLAHLDELGRGEDPVCDPERPATCQQGDLSGKFGKVTSDPYSAKFHDPYTSLLEGDGAYFANRSFVFHFANKTRISCANFTVISGDTSAPPPLPIVPNPSTSGSDCNASPAQSVPLASTPTGSSSVISAPISTGTATPVLSNDSITSTSAVPTSTQTFVPVAAAMGPLSALKSLAIAPVVVGLMALL
ncbi:hypothetical protein GGS23DRAFT_608983 [Durotheca rogersii]|uniref:uncharacterized protein n=1 Tax=Durotheca rogersii TaxID=419775 RepID=UPI00221EB5F7|nr:uncharacterized protein GGS23DRAFT_608983 [Durotheca rogersii]KAI5868329.1 hypothetical protein GGS23DRAFT_608983 [Durotheca rogersii]